MGWQMGWEWGNHGLGMRLSEMWGKLQKYPHRFEVVLSVQGIMGISCVRISQEVGVFARVVFWNSKARVEMEGVVGARRDKDIS